MNTTLLPSTDVPSGRFEGGAPAFVQRRANGVFIVRDKLPSTQAFSAFVDELFGQGFRFEGLDYRVFLALAFPHGADEPLPDEVRLATGMVRFAPERQALYKQCRFLDQSKRAEYMFERVSIEVIVDQGTRAQADSNPSDVALQDGDLALTRLEPTMLVFDEFVADMWRKGVRYGLDASRFEQGRRATQPERLVIANECAPTPGIDARIQEVYDGLHRDNSPVIRDGRVDLRRLKNRFPQVNKDQRMIHKIPRQMGLAGYRVNGLRVEPAEPKDLNLDKLAGPGTRIDWADEGLFICADMDGFLSIELGSNRISVSEKIENRGGISAKTTGDLSLMVNEFVEHGEVQEGRQVEGHHMNFTAAVYGDLISTGGDLMLNNNLVGGSARSVGGRITIKKRASSARIEAPGGVVELRHAENCQIVGQTVHIGEAVNCDIVAEVLRVDLATGCAVAAKSVTMGSTGSRKGNATVVSVLVPDPQVFAGQAQALQVLLTRAQQALADKAAEIKQASTDPKVARVASIKAMVQAGKITLTEAQAHNLHQMQTRFAALLRVLDKLEQEHAALTADEEAQREALDALKRDQAAQSTGRSVVIRQVAGATLVQQMRTATGEPDCAELRGMDLHNRLSAAAPKGFQLFSGDSGHVAWPDTPAATAA